jgi:hypothetical protein
VLDHLLDHVLAYRVGGGRVAGAVQVGDEPVPADEERLDVDEVTLLVDRVLEDVGDLLGRQRGVARLD